MVLSRASKAAVAAVAVVGTKFAIELVLEKAAWKAAFFMKWEIAIK